MCPFLDEADPRCAAHQSLEKLDEALALCVGEFRDCPLYQMKLLGNAPHHGKATERVRAAG